MNIVNHKNFLFKVLKVLDSNNIEYCLWGGTLLGAVREKGFLVNDTKDTDIAVDEKYYWEVKRIFDKQVQSKKMKWHYLWRRELSVCSLDNKIKVDVFFLEKKNEDKGYIYSYTPNCNDKKWNHEWRMTFDSNDFFPTKKMEFFRRMVKIPNNKEKLLEELYGDWKTPDSTWKCEPESYTQLDTEYDGFFPAGVSPENYKINNKKYKYGYAMTTIQRNECAKKTITSVLKHCPDMKIYVADQNEPTSEMYNFYEEHDVEYYFVEPNSGLSRNRNFLVDKIKEDYVFIGDDDFIFTKQTNVNIMKNILDERNDIGIVGGNLTKTNNYCRRLIWDNKNKLVYMITLDEEKMYTKNKNVYMFTDLVLNFFLARRETLIECKWDDELKLAEHLEYFLRFKKTKWKIAYTPDVTAVHDSKRNADYIKCRQQSKKYYKIMLQKYKMNSLESIISLKDSPLNISSVVIPPDELFVNKEIKKTPVVNKKENKNMFGRKVELVIKPIIIDIATDLKRDDALIKQQVQLLHCLLQENNIEYCILKKSCLEAIQCGKLKSDELFIGVKDLDKVSKLIESLNLKLNVHIENSYPKKTKTAGLFGMLFNVPLPVVGYLESLYGKNWRTFDK